MFFSPILALSNTAPISLTFVGYASSSTSSITIPAGAQEGDLAVLMDGVEYESTRTYGLPSNWARLSPTTTGAHLAAQFLVSKLNSTQVGGYSLAVGTTTDFNYRKQMYVFRPSSSFSTVSLSDPVNGEYNTGNPSAQVLSCSGGTPPVLVFGYGISRSGAFSFSTMSPALDRTDSLAPGTTSSRSGYKLYNPGDTISNHTIDMNDEGSWNLLTTVWISVS